jgi:hypothetical protein
MECIDDRMVGQTYKFTDRGVGVRMDGLAIESGRN